MKGAGPEPGFVSGVRRDLVYNTIGSVLVSAALLLAMRVAGNALTVAAFGILFLVRRVGATGANLLQLGMSQTLTRYLALHEGQPSTQRRFLVFAVVAGALVSIVALPTAWLLREPLSQWWFPGAENGGRLAFWCTVIMVATMANFLAYSSYLARREVLAANIILLCNAQFLLIGLVLFGREWDVEWLLALDGCGMLAVSSAALAARFLRRRSPDPEPPAPWREVALEYTRYGLPRAALTFMDASLPVVGPWLLRDDPREAGFLIVALSLTRIAQLATRPVTKIASVVTANLVGQQATDNIAKGVRLTCGLVIYAAAGATVLLVPWARQILQLWLGQPDIAAGAYEHFSILWLAIGPFMLFSVLRGIVETHWVFPFNLVSLIAAVATHVGLFYALQFVVTPARAADYSLLAAVWVLAGLTLYWLRQYLPPVRYWGLLQLLALGGLTLVAGLWAATKQDPMSIGAYVLALGGSVAAIWRMWPPELLRDVGAFLRRK